MERKLIYLGGNGHCAARLAPAREAMRRLGNAGTIESFNLFEVPYAGFEGRPRSPDFETFLNGVSASISEAGGQASKAILYGTGIGALLALCLRARGEWTGVPLLMQAPVLWGLERRLMPRLMRLGPTRRLLGPLFTFGWFQRRFVRKQFERPLAPKLQQAFFAGYAQCPALADLFAWLTPRLLRRLEEQFASRPDALRQVAAWWGGRDRVVSPQELTWTEQALKVRWPVRMFPTWGHYPMLDEPDDWVRNLADVLANPEAIPGPVGPEAR
jgi:pimeloyl-ACP methyl ester carboxylesterase